MSKTVSEYRINKKGAECFRTRSTDEAHKKLKELQAKRPGIYTLQARHVSVNNVGTPQLDWRGEPAWSAWCTY